jgi:hypothetical protein
MIQQYQLPVKIIRLDTEAFRDAAKNGPYFQIKNVPTLIVTFRDGNLQQFVGQPKVLEWLKMAVSPPGKSPGGSLEAPHSKHREKETRISLSSSDEEEIPEFGPSEKKKKKKKKSKSHPSKKPSVTEEGGLYGPNKKKKKKKQSVEFYSSGDEDDGVDIEFVNDGRRPPAPPTGGLMVGSQAVKRQRMKGSSVAEMAKQMERDRTNTLGYDEKNLPVRN